MCIALSLGTPRTKEIRSHASTATSIKAPTVIGRIKKIKEKANNGEKKGKEKKKKKRGDTGRWRNPRKIK